MKEIAPLDDHARSVGMISAAVAFAKQQQDYYYKKWNLYYRMYRMLKSPPSYEPLIAFYEEMFNWWFNQHIFQSEQLKEFPPVLQAFLLANSDDKAVDGETGANDDVPVLGLQ